MRNLPEWAKATLLAFLLGLVATLGAHQCARDQAFMDRLKALEIQQASQEKSLAHLRADVHRILAWISSRYNAPRGSE